MNMFINNEDYKRFYIENKQCFTEKAWSILNQLVDNEINYMFISDTKENLFDGIVLCYNRQVTQSIEKTTSKMI